MGHIKAKTIPGRSPMKLAALQVGIVDQLRAYPDVSLEWHCERMASKRMAFGSAGGR